MKIRKSIGDDSSTGVYFEVPNAMYTLRDLGIWDLIYEHYSYFSINSLVRLFSSCGFRVRDISETYEGQFIGIEVFPGNSSDASNFGNLHEIVSYVNVFEENYQFTKQYWKQNLDRLISAGKRVVIWGTGSKGVTFLNLMNLQDQVEYAIDINPRKHDRYVAGTGQRIMPPSFLKEYQADIVLVMNPLYKDEVCEMIEWLNVSPEVVTVGAQRRNPYPQVITKSAEKI
jgi:hypothetical protein